MSRYIDADLIEYHDSFTNDGEFWNVAFKDDIDNIPATDVRENVSGEWISDRLITTSGGTYGVKRCSNCEHYYQKVQSVRKLS